MAQFGRTSSVEFDPSQVDEMNSAQVAQALVKMSEGLGRACNTALETVKDSGYCHKASKELDAAAELGM